jgi:hypothetical protein
MSDREPQRFLLRAVVVDQAAYEALLSSHLVVLAVPGNITSCCTTKPSSRTAVTVGTGEGSAGAGEASLSRRGGALALRRAPAFLR